MFSIGLDTVYMVDNISLLLERFLVNLSIAIPSYIVGTVLGLIITSVWFIKNNSRSSKYLKALCFLTEFFSNFIRSLSVLIIGLFVFFVFPHIGLNIPAYPIAIIALSLGTMGLSAELLKPAFSGTKEVIYEPALALGAKQHQTLRLIIPYVIRNNIPILVTTLITVIKDSVIFSALGIVEISKTASQLISFDYKALEVWILILLINFVFIQMIIALGKLLDKKLRSH